MKRVQQRITLANARFFAYHGYYPEEQILGTVFFVDIEVVFDRDWPPSNEEDLGRTVNYEVLYRIARDEMSQPRKLLETVAEAMLMRVQGEFPFVEGIKVHITKENPPFGGDLAQARVALHWAR